MSEASRCGVGDLLKHDPLDEALLAAVVERFDAELARARGSGTEVDHCVAAAPKSLLRGEATRVYSAIL